jgi:DNA polymerase III epsilon subunit-like protein
MGNILFVDTETTGLDPEKNRLLQIAARLDVDKSTGVEGLIEYFETHVGHFMFFDNAPVFEISLGALKVNKRSLLNTNPTPPGSPIPAGEAMVMEERVAITRFVEWLLVMHRKYGDFLLAGHNVDFDIRFLNAALRRAGIVGLDELVGHRRVDTAPIALFLKDAGILKIEKGSLEETAKALGISTEGQHDAKFDVDLTASIYYEMKKLVTPK